MKWLLKLFSKKNKIWMGSFNMMHTFYTLKKTDENTRHQTKPKQS